MSYRTNYLAVSKLVDVDDEVTTDLEFAIETANRIVTKICAPETDYLDSTDLELIERYLSAHFYQIRDPSYKVERAGSVSGEIETKIDRGLDLTRHGQMAKQLDFSGALARWDEQVKDGKAKRTAGVTWLGSTSDDLWHGEDIDT